MALARNKNNIPPEIPPSGESGSDHHVKGGGQWVFFCET